MSQFPPPPATPPIQPGPMTGMRAHRGVLILVLGILGLVVCLICGIIAWVMGSADIREMESGRMDPSGLGLTKAGKICGIVSVALNVLLLVVLLALFALGLFAGVSQSGM